jgi:hypothetical protein
MHDERYQVLPRPLRLDANFFVAAAERACFRIAQRGSYFSNWNARCIEQLTPARPSLSS